MTTLKVYVAAAFAERAHVRRFHDALRARNHIPTSKWANVPGDGVEARLRPDEFRAIATESRDHVRDSDLLVLFASEAGRESFCEAAYAIERGIPVVWVGVTCASAFLERVTRLPADAPAVLVLDTIDELAPTLRPSRAGDVAGCEGVLAALGVGSTIPAPPESHPLLDKLTPRAFDSRPQISDPVLRACLDAPVDPRPVSPEERETVRAAKAAHRAAGGGRWVGDGLDEDGAAQAERKAAR